jgi:hypothetical protein
MPITFPSHAAAVLPLKVWRPRWFDGVALVVGSAAPDLSYALDGSRLERPIAGGQATFALAHSWPWFALWALPVTFLCAALIRRAAPTIAAHLPARPEFLALRDYGVLALSRPGWPVTAVSAVLGAASHVLWDRLADHGWLDPASSLAGAVITVGLLVHIGRRRLLRAWHGSPPAVEVRPLLFWSVAGLAAALGLAGAAMLPGAGLAHTTGARLLWVLALAVLLASVVVRIARR